MEDHRIGWNLLEKVESLSYEEALTVLRGMAAGLNDSTSTLSFWFNACLDVVINKRKER